VKGHRRVFGKVVDEKMVLNELGEIVEERIWWLGMHFSYVNIDQYVVMPNHVHMILVIDTDNVGTTLGLSLHKNPVDINDDTIYYPNAFVHSKQHHPKKFISRVIITFNGNALSMTTSFVQINLYTIFANTYKTIH